MKRFKQTIKYAVPAIAIATASTAHAALDTGSWSVEMGPVEAVMGIVMVALLALFGYRKVIKTTNRS